MHQGKSALWPHQVSKSQRYQLPCQHPCPACKADHYICYLQPTQHSKRLLLIIVRQMACMLAMHPKIRLIVLHQPHSQQQTRPLKCSLALACRGATTSRPMNHSLFNKVFYTTTAPSACKISSCALCREVRTRTYSPVTMTGEAHIEPAQSLSHPLWHSFVCLACSAAAPAASTACSSRCASANLRAICEG